MFSRPKRKSELEIKIEQIVLGNPQELRAYLISEGYRSDRIESNASMKQATMHLVSCNPDAVPTLLTLHPDYALFNELAKTMQPKAAEPQPESLPSVNVEVNTTSANGQFEFENNNKLLIIQKQVEEIERLKSAIQNQPYLPTPMPTPAPTAVSQSEEYIDVQDVCVYGIKLKHWIIGIVVLLATAIVVTVITFKNKNN